MTRKKKHIMIWFFPSHFLFAIFKRRSALLRRGLVHTSAQLSMIGNYVTYLTNNNIIIILMVLSEYSGSFFRLEYDIKSIIYDCLFGGVNMGNQGQKNKR